MESKNVQDKPHSSKKSDVIIITPDELVKLGLLPEIIHTSDNPKQTNENSGIKGKINGKTKSHGKRNTSKTKVKKETELEEQGTSTIERHLNSKALPPKESTENKKAIPPKQHTISKPVILNSEVLNKNVSILNTATIAATDNNIVDKSSKSLVSVQNKPLSTGKPHILNSQVKLPGAQENAKNKTVNKKVTLNYNKTRKITKDLELTNSGGKIKNKNINERTDETSNEMDILSGHSQNLKQSTIDNDVKKHYIKEKHWSPSNSPRKIDFKESDTLRKTIEGSHINLEENQFQTKNENLNKINITNNNSDKLSNVDLKQLISKDKCMKDISKSELINSENQMECLIRNEEQICSITNSNDDSFADQIKNDNTVNRDIAKETGDIKTGIDICDNVDKDLKNKTNAIISAKDNIFPTDKKDSTIEDHITMDKLDNPNTAEVNLQGETINEVPSTLTSFSDLNEKGGENSNNTNDKRDNVVTKKLDNHGSKLQKAQKSVLNDQEIKSSLQSNKEKTIAIPKKRKYTICELEKNINKKQTSRESNNLQDDEDGNVYIEDEENGLSSLPLVPEKHKKKSDNAKLENMVPGNTENIPSLLSNDRQNEKEGSDSQVEKNVSKLTQNDDNKELNSVYDGGHLKTNLCNDLTGKEIKNLEGEGAGLSKVEVKLPRKRGRPKKNANGAITMTSNEVSPVSLENNSDVKGNDDRTSIVINTDTGDLSMSTPVPKKRGRKRKSEQIVNTTPPPIVEEVPLDQSRSGRKRKKINYWEVENEQENNDHNDSEDRRKVYKSELKKVCITQNCDKVESSKSNILVPEQDIEELNMETTNEENNSAAKLIENASDMLKSEQNTKDITNNEPSIDGNNSAAKLDENNSNISNSQENAKEISNGETTNNKNSPAVGSLENSEIERKSKYRKTGDTVMMINSVFAAAFKNSLQNETPDGPNEASSSLDVTPPPGNTATRRRGRPKKSIGSQGTVIVIDQNNMATCVICKEKVNNDDWASHNRTMHNNLAWRQGEQELALEDKRVVGRILTPILSEDKVVTCKKCKDSFTKVNNFTDHMEKCSGIISSTGSVTCAICKAEMEKTKWPHHKLRQHNNLAWRIGDRPLDLNNQSLVMTVLTGLYKAKKPLYCYKCNTSKKSVIGFLSHQSQCGIQLEEAKIKCQLCDKKVLPVSMLTHIKMVHEAPKKEKRPMQSSDYFDVSTGNNEKRKAAKTALMVLSQISNEKMIQEYSKHYVERVNFSEESFVKLQLKNQLVENKNIQCKFDNCSFESDSAMDLIEHMHSCENKPDQYYTCKKCIFISNTVEEMKEHLQSAHEISIVDDEYQATNDIYEEDEMLDIQMKRGSLKETQKREKDPNYKVKPTCILQVSKKPYQLFSQAYNFTMAFCQQNYSNEELFKSLRYSKSDWLLLDDDSLANYLPQNAQSCDVTRCTVKRSQNVLKCEYEFRKFELFEVECNEDIYTIFCGGSIQALAWMPTPYHYKNCQQVLAVATVNDFDKKYLVNEQYNEQSLLQFWDFGVLCNKHPMSEPKLMFGLTLDFGPVRHIEWCPSGCYEGSSGDDNDATMSRMGLVAVATSDSVVYIYSVPHLKEDQMGLVYKVKPLLKLYVTYDEEYLTKQKFFAAKISWTKGAGHRYIAVGYTDGMVALFDLETANLLRCTDKDDCEVLLPYRTFQAHVHMITVLDLIHLDGGKRWLLTGSFDRNLTVWDLNSDLNITSKRLMLSDGIWMNNWMAYVATADESSTLIANVPTLVLSYRDYMYEHVNIKSTISSVKTVSESLWLNGLIQCSALGEISGLFLPQLLHGLDYDKKIKKYGYMLGYTKLINKNLTPEERINEDNIERCTVNELRKKKIVSYAQHLLGTKNMNDGKYHPVFYQEATEKYGLLFCDTKMDNISTFQDQDKKTHEDVDVPRANLYPLQSVNKVACNPNMQASLYYATGYQAGFVRVTYMKFLENDLQIK